VSLFNLKPVGYGECIDSCFKQEWLFNWACTTSFKDFIVIIERN